ncbi:MAG: competence/damage-inducible protein A [Acidimicrobiaceae bacterium]|nr:competence/damage-inducible protein A [Acidimicrobiaceae bacterium]|tara:strand:- start:2964 stop:4211 length:1248 start_codon:yes stop_codon:yes gene_type:complete
MERFSCEVVAVGTELLLGQIVDTNSSWIGEQLALNGIESYFQTKVGDNPERIKKTLEQAIGRSDFVIVCGGLGPTQDDLTRDVIAEIMGVELVTDNELVDRISAIFGNRGREMPLNNLRQAQVPLGAETLSVMPGTAPGLKAVINGKTLYAVPGVPWEMKQMILEDILPDMRAKAGITSIIGSKTLRTWGDSESGLSEKLADEIERLDQVGGATIAFLASGIEGLKVRLTTKGDSKSEVENALNAEAEIVASILGDKIIFSYDDQTMEEVVLDMCRGKGLTLGVAESLTGGLIGSRLTSISGSSEVFKGSIVAYSSDVKRALLDTPDVPSVSQAAAEAMTVGACRTLNADIGLAVTGEAGPEPLEEEVGRVWMATSVGGVVKSSTVKWPFDRERIRQFTTITVLNALRLRLEDEI